MKKTLHLLFIFLITLQVAVKAQDRIYWGIPNKNIGSAKLDGTDVKLSVVLSGQTFDMETDFYKGILYWGDDSSVKKANTDGTNLQTLYTGSKTIGGLALDLTSNKLYFSEFQGGNVIIRRCNLDGTGMEVIVTSPNSNGRTYNLTISTTLQKLYWTESTAVNTNSTIMRCNLDGTNFETLMTTTKFIPGLTIDEKNQRLYLAYWSDNKVMTTDMTCSTTPTLVFGSSNGTFQMAVSNVDDKLYFGEMGSKKIRKCNLDGSLPQDIVSGLLGQPMALSIPTVPPVPTIYANDTYTFELNDFLFASVDKNLLTKIKINTLTSKGTLYLDANNNNIVDAGEEVGLNQEIAKADLVAGTLKFNPVANDYGSPYTTFNFKWFDGTSYSTLDYLQYIYVLNIAPTVTTQAVSDIGSTTATGNGNITNLGVPFPTSYGVCWNTTGLPTTSDSKVDKGSISTTGAFTAAITGLTANTTYKARTYAINEAGTSYGTEVTFTTTNLIAPTATTGTATGITSTGAILNGSINANNTSTTITFEYGLDTSYGTIVTADQSPVTGTSATAVSYVLTGLTPNTTYHYRVIGVNGGGTTTGADQSFTTQSTSQAISFGALDTKTYGDAPYDLTATSTSGLAISYSSNNTAVARVSGSTVTIVGAGTANITASQAGNTTYAAAANVIQQLTINKKALSVTAITDTKIYDGTTVSTAIPTVGTLATGDAINGAPTQVFDNAAVGTTHVLTASGLTIKNGSADVTGNYDISYATATGTINKLGVTVTAVADTKTYDGTTVSTAIPTVGTLATGDAINVAPAQVFDNASVGTTHVLTASGLTIKNGSADVTGNYDISYTTATGTINKLGVTVTAVADTKTYDGTTVSTAIPTVGTLATGDAIDVAPAQVFDNAAVGTTHVLTASGLTIKNGSADVTGNYDISYATATGTINKLGVTVAAVADTKTYDGTTVSTAIPAVGTLATGDAINVAPAQVFDNATVGTTHVLTASGLTIKNGSADVTGNYDISYTTATGTINKLGVTVTAVADTKTYDGTTVSAAIPTVGTLATGDAINVAPMQVFDIAAVGTTHVLTASGLTIKNGSADVTGNYDISYASATGSITAKALTITIPAVTLSKVHDGNTLAAVTAGTLSGVVAGDAGKVTVAASASYDNATVGANKTITVTYTLGGSSAGNYSAPANYIATGAEIYSATIALQPLSDPTPNPTNTGLVLSYSVVTGGPTQYQITFETRAVSVGFQNVSYTALVTTGADGSISITVPKGTRPGKYKGTLKMRNDSGVESTAYDFVITVNIPTEYIAVKYNRVLVLDNSTRIFKAYQWFKNGVAIEGATKQFYRDPKGLVGTYSMQATDIDGEIIYSFPKELNIPIAQKVTAYPSLVRANQTCTVEITDESMELDLKGAELSVYSSQGIRVYHTTNVEKLNTVKLPAMDGTYSGRVTTTDGQSFLFKVIVAN